MILGTDGQIGVHEVLWKVSFFCKGAGNNRIATTANEPKILSFQVYIARKILEIICMSTATPQRHTSSI